MEIALTYLNRVEHRVRVLARTKRRPGIVLTFKLWRLTRALQRSLTALSASAPANEFDARRRADIVRKVGILLDDLLTKPLPQWLKRTLEGQREQFAEFYDDYMFLADPPREASRDSLLTHDDFWKRLGI
jgi:hypothetical protein